MKTLTKNEILKMFGDTYKSRVWYKGKKDYINYDNPKHINWKQVIKMTILFPSKKIRYDDKEGLVSRDGVALLLKN